MTSKVSTATHADTISTPADQPQAERRSEEATQGTKPSEIAPPAATPSKLPLRQAWQAERDRILLARAAAAEAHRLAHPGVTFEWIERKSHYVVWRDGEKLAFVGNDWKGGRKIWVLRHGDYMVLRELAAETKEAAAEVVAAMAEDGSLEDLQRRHSESREQRTAASIKVRVEMAEAICSDAQ